MIEIDDQILFSEELFEQHFVCDLAACKGACCVEGESGAPLKQEEVKQIQAALPHVLPYLPASGRAAIEEMGVSTVDLDGELVTPIVGGVAECAFTVFEKDGTAKCGIEMAWKDGKIPFRKPISCHLYPIRVAKLKDRVALNYHHWPICAPACECGSKLKVPAYRFLKDAITREWGAEMFSKIDVMYHEWYKVKDR